MRQHINTQDSIMHVNTILIYPTALTHVT